MITNRDGGFAADVEVPELLAGQLVQPIAFVAALRTAGAAARRLIAIGPGKALRGLVRRTLGAHRDVEIVDDTRSIERARRAESERHAVA
jgi:malonyl CoA-acyl carrier protein transacylase